MHLFPELENLLKISSPTEKGIHANIIIPPLRERLANAPDVQAMICASDTEIYSPDKPSYTDFCALVHGSQVKRRRNLDTTEGRAVFIHAIAHIEFSAIDLALDAAYRFRGLPAEFYSDWLLVAHDEVRHFQMLAGILRELGYEYGDFPVHDGLFMAGLRSRDSLAVRMAAVHRHLEGNGLDAFPEFERKFSGSTDPMARKIYEALNLIAHEEIAHVSLGTKWFQFACVAESLPQDNFHAYVEQAIPNVKFSRAKLNMPARLAAGFTPAELQNWPES